RQHRKELRRASSGNRFASTDSQIQRGDSGELEERGRCDHCSGSIGRGRKAKVSGRVEDFEALPANRGAAWERERRKRRLIRVVLKSNWGALGGRPFFFAKSKFQRQSSL